MRIGTEVHRIYWSTLGSHLKPVNLSASHAGLELWDKAVEDAKECIKLNPQFMKGYYRLATAQLELGDFELAIATIKQGLALDANNTQLLKVMRTIKQAKRAATVSATTNEKPIDNAISQELRDLHLQHADTNKEHNKVQVHLTKLQRESRMNQITLDELEKNPSEGSYFRSVGKVFVKHSREEIFGRLKTALEEQGKNQSDLMQKLEFLERRMHSQEQNIQELRASSS